jgi:hypothetical protein
MRQTSARILRALHEGHVLKRIVDRCQEDPDCFIIMTWQIEEYGGETFIETPERPNAYRRDFSEAAHDQLWMADLVEGVPNTGTNEVIVMTPVGLAKAQELYGPIAVKVVVKHEDGIEALSPAPDGSTAVPTGEIVVRDDMEPVAPGGP